MTLSSALTAALSGLQVSSTAVQIASSNIANAQTDGYTTKKLSLSSRQGSGVEISDYSRESSAILTTTLHSATSTASHLSTQNSYLKQVQTILDSTGNPPALSDNLSQFQSAWTQFSANPSDSTLEVQVVSSGRQLATTLNTIASEVSDLEVNAKSNLETDVETLNDDLIQLRTLNVNIATALATNQATGDLEDQRDQIVNDISKYVSIKVMERTNAQIAIYTTTGSALFDGTPQEFSLSADGRSIMNSSGSDVTSAMSGGTLQALTDFLSPAATTASGVGVLEKLKSQLQNYANMFIATTTNGNSFADTYNSADTSSGELTDSFFTSDIDDTTGLPDLSSFAVNEELIKGTAKVKAAAATDINDFFSSTTTAIKTTDEGGGVFSYTTSNTFSATGLTAINQTVSGISTYILSGFQQAANSINTQYATASTQQAYYKSSLSSQTGVNTDAELINLTNWENSYAAAAHVISTVQSMMKTLEEMVA